MPNIATSGFLGPSIVTWGFGGSGAPVPPTPAPPFDTPLLDIIPSYLYQQYADDQDLQAFVRSFNALAQGYLDWFNQTPLGLYTSPNVSGPLLDWIGQGLYGISRPVFSSLVTRFTAGMNSAPMNTVAMNGNVRTQSGTATLANDDYYKRVMTWWLYAGNGRHFSIEWLRLRVARFLYGVNGGDVTLSQSQTVHIQPGTLAVPGAPTLAYVPGGSFGSRRYGVRNAYVSSVGEGLAGSAAAITVPANYLLVSASPPPSNGAIGYNTYVTVLSTSPTFVAGMNSAPMNTTSMNGSKQLGVPPLTRQNLSLQMIGSNWGEPSTGLIVGANLPTADNSNSPSNFIITVPASTAATYMKQAFQQGELAFPFMFSATIEAA